jgi:hypothetical protein
VSDTMSSSSEPTNQGRPVHGHRTNASIDIEKQGVAEHHLRNTTVQSISWRDITVTVKDRETKRPKAILSNVSGIVHAGTIPSSLVDSSTTPILTPFQARSSP